MEIAKVKIRNVKTGAIEEVKKVLASDYIGTGDFELYEEKEKKEAKPNDFKFSVNKEEK